MPGLYALMTDEDRAVLLRKWLQTYFEELGKEDGDPRLATIDHLTGMTEATRRSWFKEEFGQRVLAEFKTDLEDYSRTRVALRRHKYLDDQLKIACGEDPKARPLARTAAARFCEEVYQASQHDGETAPVGRISAFLLLYQGKSTAARRDDVVEGEVISHG